MNNVRDKLLSKFIKWKVVIIETSFLYRLIINIITFRLKRNVGL